jgi:phage shock protein A
MSYINKSKLPADGNREVRKELTVRVENYANNPNCIGDEIIVSYPVKTKGRKPTLKELVEKLIIKVDGLDSRLEKVETRLEKVETRLEKLETRVDGLESRVLKLESRVLKLEVR